MLTSRTIQIQTHKLNTRNVNRSGLTTRSRAVLRTRSKLFSILGLCAQGFRVAIEKSATEAPHPAQRVDEEEYVYPWAPR